MAENPAQSDPSVPDPSGAAPAPESVAAAPRPHLVCANGARPAAGASLRVEAHDFRNPAFLSENELRRLRGLHEDFVRYLGARLSLFLRMELDLKLAGLAPATYVKFTESLPSPTHLSLFKIGPLPGVGILNLHPRLALAIADRLLGGRGQSVKTERNLTEIEVALLEDVILIILEEWCGQWQSEPALHGAIIGHESNGRFLQTSPKDAIVLVLSLEVSFGDGTGPLQIGVPYYTIEPLVKKLQARRSKDAAVIPPARPQAWQASYDPIEVPLRAEWQPYELSLREISSLRVGDVLELSASHLQETTLLLNGTPKFTGTVGLDTDRVAIKISRQLSPADSNHV